MIPECHKLHHKCGLAALGSNQEELELLAAAFWYTFEMGMCIDEKSGERRHLGGALLSSIKEFERANSVSASNIIPLLPFDDLSYKQIQYSGL